MARLLSSRLPVCLLTCVSMHSEFSTESTQKPLKNRGSLASIHIYRERDLATVPMTHAAKLSLQICISAGSSALSTFPELPVVEPSDPSAKSEECSTSSSKYELRLWFEHRLKNWCLTSQLCWNRTEYGNNYGKLAPSSSCVPEHGTRPWASDFEYT